MIIGSIKEREHSETRAALTPIVVQKLVAMGHTVVLEKHIGKLSGYTDSEYIKSGTQILNSAQEVYSKAQIILQILPPPPSLTKNLTSKQILIADFNEITSSKYSTKAKILRLERVPRTSVAQSIDILSSQSTVRGYMGALYALYHAERIAPQIMTAAASLKAASALVVGASLTGLQASSYLKKAGCRVTLSDINPQNKDLAASVGANFSSASSFDEITALLKNKDFIFTAASTSKKSLSIITREMFPFIKPHTVVIDTTATNIDIKENVSNHHFYFHRNRYFERLAPQTATELWANNMLHLLQIISPENHLNLTDNRIIPMLL